MQTVRWQSTASWILQKTSRICSSVLMIRCSDLTQCAAESYQERTNTSWKWLLKAVNVAFNSAHFVKHLMRMLQHHSITSPIASYLQRWHLAICLHSNILDGILSVLRRPLFGRVCLKQKPHLQTVKSTTVRKTQLCALPAKGMMWRYANALCLFSVATPLLERLC